MFEVQKNVPFVKWEQYRKNTVSGWRYLLKEEEI